MSDDLSVELDRLNGPEVSMYARFCEEKLFESCLFKGAEDLKEQIDDAEVAITAGNMSKLIMEHSEHTCNREHNGACFYHIIV